MPYHNEPNTTILQPHTKYLAYYILTKKTTAHNTNHKKYLVNYNLTKNTTTHKSLQGANLTKNTTLHKPHHWEQRIFFLCFWSERERGCSSDVFSNVGLERERCSTGELGVFSGIEMGWLRRLLTEGLSLS
jgi:hypothetical protein